MSLKKKLIVSIVMTVAVIASVASSIFIYVRGKQLAAHELEHLSQVIDYSHQLTTLYLRTGLGALELAVSEPIYRRSFSTDPAMAKENLALVEEHLALVQKTSGTFEGLGLMSKDCVLLAGPDNLKNLIGRDFSDRDYCKGIKSTGASYVSTAFVSARTNHVVISLAVPVKDTTNELVGFVVGGIDVVGLRDHFSDLQKFGYAVLLDRVGNEFVDTRHQIEKISTADEQSPEIQAVNARIKNGQQKGSFEQVGSSGKKEFIVYRQYPDFTVIKSRPSAVVLEQVRLLSVFQIAMLIGELLAISFLLTLLVGRVTQKISRLSRIAEQIATGKLDIKLSEDDFKEKDETGILARAFNEMAIRLSNTYKNLDEKVRQRTVELEERNKELESGSVELKKALESAERASKLMVGRELEMSTLKKRIEELEGKNTQSST